MLVADELAVQFSISRTGARDILTWLSDERLVKQIPYVGSCVTEIAGQDIQEIYVILGALESLAVRNGVIRIDSTNLRISSDCLSGPATR